MQEHLAQTFITRLLARAGIAVGGREAWDIQIHNDGFYSRVARDGSLGLGESYMDGWWDAERLDEFFTHVHAADLERDARLPWRVVLQHLGARFMNFQRGRRAFAVGEHHYDIGNDLYEAMLDKRLTYTCGYFKDARTLDKAQEDKLDLVCRKLGLQRGQRVLDIGCGWGSFLQFATERYGVSGLGITVSKEQVELATKRVAGLPIEIKLRDYRAIEGEFDHIVSLGMFEHVGVKNFRTYMQTVHRHLRESGLFLLHTIGHNTSHTTDPWFEKYIFPNSMIPSPGQIAKASEGLFVMEDWHNFGAYYDPTLMAWFSNFDRSWPKLAAKYGERFFRMWKYYLLASAGSFRARKNQLWQIVFSKSGVPGGYEAVR